jgi:hypothetical protein
MIAASARGKKASSCSVPSPHVRYKNGEQAMTRKANQLAEKMVKATSRRGFLGRIARLAAGAAFALAGLAAGTANGGWKHPPYKDDNETLCIYWCPSGHFISKRVNGACKASWRGCSLAYVE